MDYTVEVKSIAARPTAAVATSTTFDQFPELLREVHTALASEGVDEFGRSFMLMHDVRTMFKENGHLGAHDVEVGVELEERFETSGNVIVSSLPAGMVASTVHRGGFEGLPLAHQAVAAWCAEHGHELIGPMWELYGAPDDSHENATEIYYLIGE